MMWSEWIMACVGTSNLSNLICNSVINACAQNGSVKRAEQWFKWMEEAHVQPNVTSYSSVINACAQKGSVKRAEQWFNWMEEARVQLDVTSYSSTIHACAQN